MYLKQTVWLVFLPLVHNKQTGALREIRQVGQVYWGGRLLAQICQKLRKSFLLSYLLVDKKEAR